MAFRLYAGLNHDQLDRVLSQGITSAASALSKLLGREVRVSLNEFRLVPIWEVAQTLGEPDHVVIGVTFRLTGEMEGCLVLLLERPGVLALVDSLFKLPTDTTRAVGDIERSAVEEVGNILANSYLNSLGHEINLLVMPGAPRFSEMPLGDLLESLLVEHSEVAVEDRFLLMRNSLIAPGCTLDGNLVIFLKPTETA
jgi:chemotaxis protein CheC